MNENIRVINSNEFINSIVKLFFILLLLQEIYIVKYIEIYFRMVNEILSIFIRICPLFAQYTIIERTECVITLRTYL